MRKICISLLPTAAFFRCDRSMRPAATMIAKKERSIVPIFTLDRFQGKGGVKEGHTKVREMSAIAKGNTCKLASSKACAIWASCR